MIIHLDISEMLPVFVLPSEEQFQLLMSHINIDSFEQFSTESELRDRIYLQLDKIKNFFESSIADINNNANEELSMYNNTSICLRFFDEFCQDKNLANIVGYIFLFISNFKDQLYLESMNFSKIYEEITGLSSVLNESNELALKVKLEKNLEWLKNTNNGLYCDRAYIDLNIFPMINGNIIEGQEDSISTIFKNILELNDNDFDSDFDTFIKRFSNLFNENRVMYMNFTNSNDVKARDSEFYNTFFNFGEFNLDIRIKDNQDEIKQTDNEIKQLDTKNGFLNFEKTDFSSMELFGNIQSFFDNIEKDKNFYFFNDSIKKKLIEKSEDDHYLYGNILLLNILNYLGNIFYKSFTDSNGNQNTFMGLVSFYDTGNIFTNHTELFELLSSESSSNFSIEKQLDNIKNCNTIIKLKFFSFLVSAMRRNFYPKFQNSILNDSSIAIDSISTFFRSLSEIAKVLLKQTGVSNSVLDSLYNEEIIWKFIKFNTGIEIKSFGQLIDLWMNNKGLEQLMTDIFMLISSNDKYRIKSICEKYGFSYFDFETKDNLNIENILSLDKESELFVIDEDESVKFIDGKNFEDFGKILIDNMFSNNIKGGIAQTYLEDLEDNFKLLTKLFNIVKLSDGIEKGEKFLELKIVFEELLDLYKSFFSNPKEYLVFDIVDHTIIFPKLKPIREKSNRLYDIMTKDLLFNPKLSENDEKYDTPIEFAKNFGCTNGQKIDLLFFKTLTYIDKIDCYISSVDNIMNASYYILAQAMSNDKTFSGYTSTEFHKNFVKRLLFLVNLSEITRIEEEIFNKNNIFKKIKYLFLSNYDELVIDNIDNTKINDEDLYFQLFGIIGACLVIKEIKFSIKDGFQKLDLDDIKNFAKISDSDNQEENKEAMNSMLHSLLSQALKALN